MSYIHRYKETYDADQEEPNCGRCDHRCDSYEAFCSKCGPEYWWHYYIRTEVHEVEITDEDIKRWKAILSGKNHKEGELK